MPGEDGELSNSEKGRIADWLKHRGLACPACAKVEGLVPASHAGTINTLGSMSKGYAVILLYCRECGFAHMLFGQPFFDKDEGSADA